MDTNDHARESLDAHPNDTADMNAPNTMDEVKSCLPAPPDSPGHNLPPTDPDSPMAWAVSKKIYVSAVSSAFTFVM